MCTTTNNRSTRSSDWTIWLNYCCRRPLRSTRGLPLNLLTNIISGQICSSIIRRDIHLAIFFKLSRKTQWALWRLPSSQIRSQFSRDGAADWWQNEKHPLSRSHGWRGRWDLQELEHWSDQGSIITWRISRVSKKKLGQRVPLSDVIKNQPLQLVIVDVVLPDMIAGNIADVTVDDSNSERT